MSCIFSRKLVTDYDFKENRYSLWVIDICIDSLCNYSLMDFNDQTIQAKTVVVLIKLINYWHLKFKVDSFITNIGIIPFILMLLLKKHFYFKDVKRLFTSLINNKCDILKSFNFILKYHILWLVDNVESFTWTIYNK